MNGDRWAAAPRRFAMVTTFYPPYSFGGDAIYLSRLVNALAADGHMVEVIHCADSYQLLARRTPPPGPPPPPNVRVRTLRSPFGPLSPLLTQQTGHPWLKRGPLREALVDARPDVIHFHNASLIGLGALFIGSAPTLYTTHEHWLICPMHVLWKDGRELCERPRCFLCQLRGKRPPQWWRYGTLRERALDRVDRFLAPSRFTMRMHLERGLAGRPFIHLPYFVPAPATLPPPLRHERPYFLFVGRLERIKGLQTLIPLFRRWGRADLLVAGEGDYGEALRRQAAGSDRIRFLGRLDQETLARLYRGATALIVPSICYEVFGIVILEAFAMGTPAVVRDLGALPEVIAESGGGFTYRTEAELQDLLERLLDDRSLRDQLGENGRAALMKRWTTRPHLAQYYAIVAELLAER
ncbi:MAG: glycosyltransferase family 4 protein [Chloroflexota bacterium]|nr:glycosyltransferase family 4 protein [Dehalococcoidia bacterium]MDW8255121.1 glycosyltransferase family 4 protein [Chloroflexota bacterium]